MPPGVVDLAGQVAGRVVGVGRVGAVAVELLLQLAEVVVGVLDDQVARAVGQLGQPAERIVAVVDRVAALIDALGALALGVVGEVERLAVGIGDRGQLVGGVVGQRRGAGERAAGIVGLAPSAGCRGRRR